MKPRKFMQISIPALLLFGVAYLAYKIWDTAAEKEELNRNIRYLPSIELVDLGGKSVSTGYYKNSPKFTILNYFNPECDHCQRMVEEMHREQNLLNEVKWLMVTTASIEKTKRFADSMKISLIPNVTVLNDTTSEFIRAFVPVSVPSFYVYRNGELQKRHSGECSIPFLLNP